MSRRRAYQLIDDASDIFKNVNHGTQNLPQSEHQARPLTYVLNVILLNLSACQHI
jgi:hypothetical protein